MTEEKKHGEVFCSFDEMVDLDRLVEHPKNPNTHPDQQIEFLAKIMRINGIRSPITVSRRSGFITKGHGRLMAARMNGWTKFPVDFQHYRDEAMEYADIVADNKIQELSKIDLSLVNMELENLGPDFDLDLLGIPGFTVEPLDRIREVNIGDENSEWVDMPDFKEGEGYIRLMFHFDSEEAREEYVKENDIHVEIKTKAAWIVHP